MYIPLDIEKLNSYSFEVGPIRPPSEGGSLSLLLRTTRNCSWSRCAFCYASYTREKFQLRTVEEIREDIDTVKALSDEIKGIPWRIGYPEIQYPGTLRRIAATIYNEVDGFVFRYNPSVRIVAGWLYAGSKTVFLQDNNSLIMRTPEQVEVIRYLKETFPTIERVTSYARSKTVAKKSIDELKELHDVGLSRLHIGLETGDDELLEYINKGVTAREHIEGGRKALEAGIEISEYVMPGLGGRAMSEQHVIGTAMVLNEIDPSFIRIRTFWPIPNTAMFEAWRREEFQLLSPHECLREIGRLMERLDVTSRVCFDHDMNPQYKEDNRLIPLFKQDYDGYKFPDEKEKVLKLVEKGLTIDESCYISRASMINTLYFAR